MRQQAGWVIGLALAWLWAVPVGAQNVEETLKLVPEDARAFILVNRVGETLLRLETLIKKMNPSIPDELRKELSKLGLDKGLDKKGDLVIVTFSPLGAEKEDMVAVFCVPVTDYKEFLSGLKPGPAREGLSEVTLGNGEKLLAAHKGKHALLAKADHAEAIKKVLVGGKNVVAATKPLHDWLAETSYSLVLTPRGMKEARTEWSKELEQAQKLTPAEVKWILPFLDGMSQFLKSDEMTHLAVGAQFDAAGNVAGRFKVLFKEDGTFARGPGKIKSLPGGPLAQMPAGPFTVAFGGPTPGDLMKALTDLKVQFLKASATKPDADKIRELEKASQELAKGIEGLSFYLGQVKEGEPMLPALVGVLRVQDSSAFLNHFEKAIRQVGASVMDLKSPLVSSIAVRRIKAGDSAALEIAVQLGDFKGLGAEEKKALEAFVGPGGKVTATLIAVGDRTVVLGYRPAGELMKLLPRDTDRGLVGDPQVAKTVKLLPEGAQWVLLYHPQGMMDLVGRFRKDAGVKFPVCPPVGIAVRLSGTSAEMEMVMPAGLMEAFSQAKPRPKEPEPKKDAPPREKDR